LPKKQREEMENSEIFTRKVLVYVTY
jgi:hypothetical protein